MVAVVVPPSQDLPSPRKTGHQLTAKQELAALQIATGRTLEEAAKASGAGLSKGELLAKLAKEYGANQGNVSEVLRDRCGTDWLQELKSPRLKIHEVIPTPIPRLLDDATIRKLRERLKARRTYLRGTSKNKYLLSGRVFCAACGYNLVAQVAYYSRVPSYRHRDGACPFSPRPCVPAAKLESDVVNELFRMFGSPAAIERAVKSAIPDCDQATKRKDWLTTEIEKVSRGKGNILALVGKGLTSLDEAEKQLTPLKEREDDLRRELYTIQATLANVPSEEQIRCYVEEIKDALGTAILVYDDSGEIHPGGNDLNTFLAMTWQDRKALIDSVFSETMPDGKPAGVYVSPAGGRRNGPKIAAARP